MCNTHSRCTITKTFISCLYNSHQHNVYSCSFFLFLLPILLFLHHPLPHSLRLPSSSTILSHTSFSHSTPPCLQVFHLLRIPLKRQGGTPLFQMSDLADKRNKAILYLFRLCYRVIQHCQQDYRKNQVCVCTSPRVFYCKSLQPSYSFHCQYVRQTAVNTCILNTKL